MPVTSGVLQGSVLGPTLFVYYINKLPSVVTNMITSFADDTKAYRSNCNECDHISWQNDIHKLTEWTNDWYQMFNSENRKVLV